MTVEYIYWQLRNGVDAVAPVSKTLITDLNFLALFGELDYFFCFDVEFDELIHKEHGMATWALFLAKTFLNASEKNRKHAAPKKAVEIIKDHDIRPFKKYRNALLKAAEYEYFKTLYLYCHGNISEMSRVAELNRKTVYEKLDYTEIFTNKTWVRTEEQARRRLKRIDERQKAKNV